MKPSEINRFDVLCMCVVLERRLNSIHYILKSKREE